MQVKYDDGSETLEPVEEKDVAEKVTKAVANPRVSSVAIHKPGSTFVGGDGVKYRVDKDGVIRPQFDKTARKKKRKAQQKARKKNRKGR